MANMHWTKRNKERQNKNKSYIKPIKNQNDLLYHDVFPQGHSLTSMLKSASSIKSKRKPSLVKMPWDDAT